MLRKKIKLDKFEISQFFEHLTPNWTPPTELLNGVETPFKSMHDFIVNLM